MRRQKKQAFVYWLAFLIMYFQFNLGQGVTCNAYEGVALFTVTKAFCNEIALRAMARLSVQKTVLWTVFCETQVSDKL